MYNPKVSIIIPAYNSEKYIKQCIKSVQKQTYANIEIVIINNNSEDRTLEIVRSLQKDDSRIRVYSKNNEGPGKARLFGFEKSTGRFILFLDSDDMFVKNAVESVVNIFLNYKADIIRFHGRYYPSGTIVENINIGGNISSVKYIDAIKMLASSDKLSSMCFQAYERRCLHGIELVDNIVYCEDYLINQEIYKKPRRLVVTSDVLYKYRVNCNSTTRTVNKNRLIRNIMERIYSCNKTIEFVNSLNVGEKQAIFGYQIDRLRFDFMKLCRVCSLKESIECIKKVLNTKEFDVLISKISENDIKKYLASISIGKRIKKSSIMKAIHRRNHLYISVYIMIYCIVHNTPFLSSQRRGAE